MISSASSSSPAGSLLALLLILLVAVGLFIGGVLVVDGVKSLDTSASLSLESDIQFETPLSAEEQYAWNTLSVTDLSHAMKHEEYERVRACKPSWKIEIRPSKFVDVCDMGEGLFGFRVWKQTGGSVKTGTARFEEVTAYIREEIKCVDDLVKFVENLKVTLTSY